MYLFPIVTTLPNGVSGNAVVGVPAYVELYIAEVDYYLRSLTTGPYTVQVRDPITNVILDTVTFNAAGIQYHKNLDNIIVPYGNGIVVDVLAIGTGALNCTVTIWCTVV